MSDASGRIRNNWYEANPGKRLCEWCGTPFRPRTSTERYCRYGHRKEAQNARQRQMRADAARQREAEAHRALTDTGQLTLEGT